MAAYCTRIVNGGDVIKQFLKPELFVDPVALLRTGQAQKRFKKGSKCLIKMSADLDHIVQILENTLKHMVPVSDDVSGFACFCDAAQIAWVKVKYLRYFP